MGKELALSPEELYYLGSTLRAKYIDYAYVAAMDDIGQNYSVFESEAKASLVKSGILMEDFGGNLEIDPTVSALMNPIFFGDVETSVDVCKLGEESTVDVYKFHFLDGTITMVTGQEGKLIVKTVDQLAIKELVSGLVPDNYNCTESKVVSEIDKDKVTRFIATKSIKIGQISVVKTYIEADGIFYREKDEDLIESVTKDMFISDVYDTIKGV